MIDPLRAGAREAVAECQQAGVLVTMVTGDHRITALAIARDLGLADRERLNQMAIGMAARGLRVLAVASGPLAEALHPEDVPPQPRNLTLLGFLGMIDPLRAGAREAVAECHRAGVLVSMVTGDHRVTALAIARDLGLADRDEQVDTAQACSAGYFACG